MKTSGFRCETKFGLLVFLGHPITYPSHVMYDVYIPIKMERWQLPHLCQHEDNDVLFEGSFIYSIAYIRCKNCVCQLQVKPAAIYSHF